MSVDLHGLSGVLPAGASTSIKNKSYFGCCADLVKGLKKVCFDLVAHFPLVLLMM